jgi:hypothetical protein
MQKLSRIVLLGLVWLSFNLSTGGISLDVGATSSTPTDTIGLPAAPAAPVVTSTIFLPLILRPFGPRRVNAPYFSGSPDLNPRWNELAIFWFGRVNQTENYSDVRVGYTDSELYVNVTSFDRRLWFDTTPSASDLIAWDSVTLVLSKDANSSSAPNTNAYRFDAQFYNTSNDDSRYRLSYKGNGSTWVTTSVPFTISPGWRGGAVNDNGDDDGWAMTFHIPFSSLGLSGPPSPGTLWKLGLSVHDRDDASGSPIADKFWPETFNLNQPAMWGVLNFGIPTYTPPTATPRQIVTVRHKLNGATVTDGEVGGGSICGGSLDRWTQWGDASDPGDEINNADFNVQNESDISDFPCFAKYYITFPLNQLPANKVVISATVTLYQFGNSNPSQAQPSLIQALTIKDNWSEATLTWNNAPLASENISSVWVNPTTTGCGPSWNTCPAYRWDVSRAVAQAYTTGQSLRLVFYSADNNYHSGKYFVSSDTGDWNEKNRPTLLVHWGDP